MRMLAELENQENLRMPFSGKNQGMVHRLTHSFEAFIGITEDLKVAYDRLRERAASMDLELKDANRRLSEKVLELNSLTQRLNDLLQSLPSAVVAVDEEGKISLFNRAAEKMMGISTEEAVGVPLKEIEGLKDFLLLGCSPSERVEGARDEERTLLSREGRRLVVTSQVAALKDAQNRPAGRIEILTDLTETDRLRREVHRLDTLVAMGEMAAAVAHQIRNPLNGVEGFASLLQRNLESQNGRGTDALRFAHNIVRGVREVNAIINGMLMLAKAESLKAEAVDLDRIVEEVVQNLIDAIENRGGGVDVQSRLGAEGILIPGDSLKLKQAMINMADNALEALKEEGRRVIRITTRHTRDQVVVRLSDSGRGMSQEMVSKVLRPFYTTRESGIGIGLSLAAKIIDLHGGRLLVRSIEGKGSVFKVVLNRGPLVEEMGEQND